jgi:FAD binding domain/Berberine and berberine like
LRSRFVFSAVQVTVDMRIGGLPFPLEPSAVAALRARLRGALLLPGERDYHEARSIWNGMTARRPSLIARVSGAADVIACVNFARDRGLPLSVRGGGHNVAGTALCDDGLTIDMSRLRAVRVDPVRAIVHADAGATWGDVDHESQPFGLVVPSGIVSNTGVAGLTMGGGFGWTSRRFGFTADNLVSFDIVSADGRLCRACSTENAELYWAVRGGGGNFGVVTSFEFNAFRLGPRLLCGMVVYPMEQVRAVARRFREVCANAPDELCCLLILRHAPAAPFLPGQLHGRPIAAIAACWAGDPATGERALRPLRTIGQPLADTVELKSFIAHQTMFDASQPFGRRYYWKSHFCAEIGDGLIEALAGHGESLPSPYSSVLLMQLGGAPTRLDPTANAVGMRNAPYVLNIQAAWEQAQDDTRSRHWALACWSSALPFSTGGVYVNFMTDDEGEARLRAAYGEPTYARLREIKTRWDPGNLFHGAQNIVPDSAQR